MAGDTKSILGSLPDLHRDALVLHHGTWLDLLPSINASGLLADNGRNMYANSHLWPALAVPRKGGSPFTALVVLRAEALRAWQIQLKTCRYGLVIVRLRPA